MKIIALSICIVHLLHHYSSRPLNNNFKMDPSASTVSEVTLEFLQTALNFPVDKFVVYPGSVAGDGYTCTLYTVDVWKSGETEAKNLLIKCFPSDAARQYFLQESGLFTTELGVYQSVIPELNGFQEDAGLQTKIKLPLAPFHAGKLLLKEQQQDGTPNTLDSYIIMTDLRKSGGFRLQDRFQGLDLDHFKLVVEAQATLHAVSWAYKIKRGVSKLEEKFPFLSTKSFQKHYENGSEDYLRQNMDVGANLFKDDPTLSAGYEHLRSVFKNVATLYYNFERDEEDGKHYTKDTILRRSLATVENEEPWEVLLHGDAWSNNVLFRYDQITGKPVEVILVDLQICREGDPFSDVNYALYASTNEDMRKKHLTSLLHIYYDTFTEICNTFSVPPLQGWSWNELNRRFHRAQIFGVYQASTLLPLMLKSPDEIVDMSKMDLSLEDMKSEDFKNSDKYKEIMEEFLSMKKPNPILERRLRGVMSDAVRAGVI